MIYVLFDDIKAKKSDEAKMVIVSVFSSLTIDSLAFTSISFSG